MPDFINDVLSGIYRHRQSLPYGSRTPGRRGGSEETDERLVRVLDDVPVGVAILGADGRLIFANAAAERMLKLPRHGVTDCPEEPLRWSVRPRGEEDPAEEWLVSRVIIRGETIRNAEATITVGESAPATVSLSAAPLRDDVPAFGDTGIVAVFQGCARDRGGQREGTGDIAFLGRILSSCTHGKVRVVAGCAELPTRLCPVGEGIALDCSAASEHIRTQAARLARDVGFQDDQVWDFVTAVGEACGNAMEHAAGGVARFFVSPDPREGEGPVLQAWIEDAGPGANTLPPGQERAFGGEWRKDLEWIVPGFSLMVSGCDRLYILPGRGGTTVVLELGRTPLTPDRRTGLPGPW